MAEKYVHGSFNGISAANDKQLFKIDDVIRALETQRQKDIDVIQAFAKAVGEEPENNLFVSNGLNIKTPEDIAAVANALTAARSMKNNGMDEILLDTKFKLHIQVLEQVTRTRCPELYHGGPQSFHILALKKLPPK